VAVILLSFSVLAFAQGSQTVAQSAAQKAFGNIKSLAGNWEGPLTTVPKLPEIPDGDRIHVSMRVTSRGHALMHEIPGPDDSNDPLKHDHPVTVFYLDGDQLMLTHYCDAGNRPRMFAKPSPDGKTIEFDFLDVAGPTKAVVMNHAVFTFIDENHHTEDWTYSMGVDKRLVAHYDLRRVK
jgi:hypothetical protein